MLLFNSVTYVFCIVTCMYSCCYVCSVYTFHCVVCVCVCIVILPPSVNLIAVDKCIISSRRLYLTDCVVSWGSVEQKSVLFLS